MNRDWVALKEHLVALTGHAYYLSREKQLLRVIEQCMRAASINSFGSYLAHLRSSPEELQRVVSHLTVSETYFFRDRPQFQALTDTVLPSLVEIASDRPPRVWSAGCSIGAEPYSLSCLVFNQFRERLHPLSILATDINTDVLEVARKAVYSDWALRQVQPSERHLYFAPIENALWELRPSLRQNVQFQRHNLVSDPIPPLGRVYDLVVCRNVLIYFDEPLIRRTLDRFYDALAPGGWLVVGYSEPNDDFFGRYDVVSRPGAILYRKPLVERTQVQLTGPGFQPTWLKTKADGPPPSAVVPPATPPSAPRTSTSTLSGIGKLKSLADGGLWRETRRLADELLAGDPLLPRAHFYKALAQEQLGEVQESAQSYRQAIYLDRSDPLTHYYWGLAQARSGAQAEAARSFRTVARLVDSRDKAPQSGHCGDVSLSLLRAQAVNQLKELQISE